MSSDESPRKDPVIPAAGNPDGGISTPDSRETTDDSPVRQNPSEQGGEEGWAPLSEEAPASPETTVMPPEHSDEENLSILEGSEEDIGGAGAGASERPEGDRKKAILEALLYVSDQPLSLDRLAGILTGSDKKEIRTLLGDLNEEYRERGRAFEIIEVAQGYQVRTRSDFSKWMAKLKQQRPQRLTRASMESLAIIAYRQPVTRAEIESIRGVDTGAVLGSLLEKRLIRILGRKEVPGRPILYGTTQDFLELFGLKNLGSLPTLREIEGMFEKIQEEEQRKQEAAAGNEEHDDEGGRPAGVESDAPEMDTRSEGEDEDDEEDEDLDGEGSDEEEEEMDEEEEEWEEERGELEADELDAVLRSTKTKFVSYEEEKGEEGEGKGEEASGEVSGEDIGADVSGAGKGEQEPAQSGGQGHETEEKSKPGQRAEPENK